MRCMPAEACHGQRGDDKGTFKAGSREGIHPAPFILWTIASYKEKEDTEVLVTFCFHFPFKMSSVAVQIKYSFRL